MSGKHITPLALVETPAVSSLALAYNAFLLDGEARRLAPKTLHYYKQQLQPFLAYAEGSGATSPETLTANHIRTYLVSLQRRGLNDNSQHAAARAIRALCYFMVNEDLLAASPMRKVKMPALDKRILPAFTTEDVRMLLDACLTARDTAIVLCLLDSGCRASEFLALNAGDIDLKTGAVTVRQGKGRKDRVAFLGAKARKALLKYLMARGSTKPSDPLWPAHDDGERLTSSGLQQVLKRLGRRAQVKHAHPHTFRRTCALWSLRAGMNIYALQQIMGHADLAILRRYLALVEQDLEDAHRKYGAVDNML